ncbi:MAG: RNA 2',3'-cyclic phosphodiesterase [Acidimicrobiales bacterium]
MGRSVPAHWFVRLFAGVWPPAEVADRLSRLQQPRVAGVRWATPAKWHVTLAFLGQVPDTVVPAMGAALVDLAARAAVPPEAVLGPAVGVLGRNVLCVPVAGLDEVAHDVRASLPGEAAQAASPFSGHLTLARVQGRRRMPLTLAGEPVEGKWTVHELRLVASTTDREGARYTTVARATIPS